VHIIGLVEHPEHVCCRYRLAAFRTALEAEGHRLDLRAIPTGLWSRFRLWWSLRHADAVILQRRLLSCFHLRLLRRHARRLIFDFDDAVFRRDSYAGKAGVSSVRLRRFMATIHAADRIVAGNEYLRKEAARFVSARRLRVIPTCVDPRNYALAEHRRQTDGVQLVWIGSSSTLQGLEAQQPLLDQIAARVPGLRCKVICDRFPRFATMPVLPCLWMEETEGQELADADIGISWLPDDRWSEGKCGLKILQYFAAGLPVVANPVGVQRHMIRHGENGFLATTPAEWRDALQRLATDAALRQRLGRAGRRLVEREYSVDHGGDLWLNLLRGFRAVRQKRAA
jgi:glycosyltransferase involved in cell wall biosynthesis